MVTLGRAVGIAVSGGGTDGMGIGTDGTGAGSEGTADGMGTDGVRAGSDGEPVGNGVVCAVCVVCGPASARKPVQWVGGQTSATTFADCARVVELLGR